MKPKDEPGQIITFFSYKGGTGRSMALANIACLLAKQTNVNKGVLVLDWDLEGPGMHHFLQSSVDYKGPSIQNQQGIIDLFLSLESILRKGKYDSPDKSEVLFDKLDINSYVTKTNIDNLKLIKAGNFDEKYSYKVNTFKWDELYNHAPWLFTSLALYLSKQYDYILVDSRTGISDTSGICTMLMPEKLVLVFTPNRQSLTGFSEIVPRAVNYRKQSDDLRPLVVFPLPSRIETTEPALRNDWRYGNPDKSIKGYQPLFEDLLKKVYDLPECNLKRYFDDVQLQHVPAYSYGETIAVNIEKDTKDRLSLSSSYARFSNRLVNLSAPWIDLPSDYDVIDTPGTVLASDKLADFRRAIKTTSKNSKETAVDYLEAFLNILEDYRLDPDIEKDTPFDERVMTNIKSFIPHRDHFAEFIKLVCLYDEDQFYFSQLFEFFEKSISFMYPPKGTTQWNDNWYDNYKFILQELFIYLITFCIKYKKYDAINLFLDEQYYFTTNIGKESTTYIEFNPYIRSIDEYRKKRLNLNRISITADILKERADIKNLDFEELMQTDFILSLRSILPQRDRYHYWFPRTLVYKVGFGGAQPFDIFFKAESPRHFETLKRILLVDAKEELISKLESAYTMYNLNKWQFDFRPIPFKSLMNIDLLYDG